MVKDCRRGVSIGARRNPSRGGARAIRCRAGARKIRHTVQALVSNEIRNYRGARQYYLRTRLLARPPVPEAVSAGRKLSQRSA